MAATAHHPLILCYHHISSAGSSRYVVTAGALERLLGRLLDDGWKPVGLDRAAECGPFGEGTVQERTFTVTFDDGFESFKTLAMPVLVRLGIATAATTFVPTGYVGQSNVWRTEPTLRQRLQRREDPPAPLMTWDDLQEVAAAGARVESHGHTHAPLNELTYEQAYAEAEDSRRLLLEHGFPGEYLALPYGWRSEECKRAIRDAGFSASFSVTGGGKDRFEIRRVPIHGTDDPSVLWLKLSGRYFDVFDAAKRVLGRK